MKTRMIPLAPAMVLATLCGQKTMTRRVVGVQPDPHHWQGLDGYVAMSRLFLTDRGLEWRFQHTLNGVGDAALWVASPYGQTGDRLLVREAWKTAAALDAVPPRDIMPGDAPIWYLADNAVLPGDWEFCRDDFTTRGRFRQARFMPKSLARITLEIASVRVERVQAISAEDARREGCPLRFAPGTGSEVMDRASLSWFGALWDAINGVRPGCSWSDNPWVWVVEYRLHEATVVNRAVVDAYMFDYSDDIGLGVAA